ncbi:hypothetical protein Spla01_02688 [Streptomyces platensis]|uniref:Histidine kinase/HSP90-like ATPase domain-containing protein n=1 Tax=Streptomyces platensis TaxID=58346 RepID=A0ABX3XWW6_STRPT|nr:ATP-binding protein [Streptomyces platensis]OSY45137.1 hypothetical protein BG653_03332 [Streptomyces platensis]
MALAREFARTALVEWDLERRADEVLLCVSELATNALLHGVPPGREYRLRLVLGEDGLLRVEVHDSGAEADWGRGLLLVSALADKWGVGERAPGKIVWCEWWPDFWSGPR